MSLKLQLFKNISAVSVINYLSKLTTIITGIMLARLLISSDFGIYGLATSIMAFVLIFDEMGLRSAVIQKKTEHEDDVFYTGFFIKSALSLGLFLILIFFIAPWSADFYNAPDVKNITILLAIVMLINNLKFLPETRIIKSNNFNKLVIPSIVENISYSLFVIFLAFRGLKYWSFVYAKLLSSILCAGALFFIMPWEMRFLFDKNIGKELLHFGKYLVLGGFLSMVIMQMDNFIVAKILGLTALGYYAVAYRWGSMFSLDIGKIVNQVLYPINVKYQDNFPMLEKIQIQSVKYVSLIIFPISVGFLITCPEFVRGVLGEKWTPAIIPLQIFSIHGLFWGLMKRGEVFVALGNPQYSSFLSAIFIILLAVLIIPLTKMIGIIGAAFAVLISFIIAGFGLVWLLFARCYHFNLKIIFRQFIIPFVSSLIMFFAIFGLKSYLYRLGQGQLTILFLSVTSGIIIYSLTIFLLMHKDVMRVGKILMIPDISMNEKVKKIILAL